MSQDDFSFQDIWKSGTTDAEMADTIAGLTDDQVRTGFLGLMMLMARLVENGDVSALGMARALVSILESEQARNN